MVVYCYFLFSIVTKYKFPYKFLFLQALSLGPVRVNKSRVSERKEERGCETRK